MLSYQTHSLALALAVTIAGGTHATAKTTYTPCEAGRYVVIGEPLIVTPGGLETDAIDYSPELVSVDSGCAPLVPKKLRATKGGTKVRVDYLSCENIFGKVVMKGRIDTTCTTMTGVFKAKKAKVKKQFTATLSFCGDGIYDPLLEQCEDGPDCGVGGTCLDGCVCLGGTTTSTLSTTSTSLGGSSTTSTSSTTTTSTSSTTSTTIAVRPDLVPTAFTSNVTTIVSGQQMTVSWTVENQGQANATTAWYESVTLSVDQSPSQNDTLLLQPYHSTQLDVGASYSMNGQSITIPYNLAAGTYYLLFRTDSYASLSESDETNNDWPTPIELTVTTPDLVPTAFTSSVATIVSGQQMTVSWTIENQGTGTAFGTWYDAVTLSADQFPSQNDTVLTSPTHSTQLAAAASYSVNGQSITIPYNLAAGTYYLILQTDYYSGLFESGQDANNVWPTPIELTVTTPDLVPTAFTSNLTTIVSGQQMTVSWTIENQGTGTAIGTWYDAVTLSVDQFPSQNDTVLTSPTHSTQLAAAASYSVNGQSITIPYNLAAGTYYLILQTDYYSGLFEDGQDANNLWPTPIELTVTTPDLVPTAFTSNLTTIVSGQQMNVSWTIENQGTGAAIGTWYDAVTLSVDQFPSQNDTVLTSPTHSTQLAAAASYSVNGQTITIPYNLAAGTYYLILQTDYYSGLFENGQDANNVWPTPIELTVTTPDLVPTAFTSNVTTITAGQQMTVSWTIENQGTGAAIGTWYDAVTLSADQFPSQNDTVLTSPTHSTQLAAAANYSVNNQVITIPGALTAGTYYLIFQTDYYSGLFEDGQDANNLWPTPIALTVN